MLQSNHIHITLTTRRIKRNKGTRHQSHIRRTLCGRHTKRTPRCEALLFDVETHWRTSNKPLCCYNWNTTTRNEEERASWQLYERAWSACVTFQHHLAVKFVGFLTTTAGGWWSLSLLSFHSHYYIESQLTTTNNGVDRLIVSFSLPFDNLCLARLYHPLSRCTASLTTFNGAQCSPGHNRLLLSCSLFLYRRFFLFCFG